MKERVSVKVDGVEMWGWIVPAKWRAELGISEWSDDQAKGKMAIQFDNGEKWLVDCLLYTSPSPRDLSTSRMPSSA